MFFYLRDIFRRHRRKFIFIGAVSGASVLLWKYAQWKMKQWQETEASECLAFARRQHHFDSNQRTCNMTVLAMLPTLRQSLTEILDSDKLTQKLKHRPANKLEIWEELKIISFSRPIAGVYSLCMMIVFLRVQLNVLGGYMYQDSFHGNNGATSWQSQATPEIQKQYLATIQYLMGNGLKEIVEVSRKAVEKCIGRKSLKENLNLEDIERLLSKIRSQIEGCEEAVVFTDCASTSLAKYFLPEEEEPTVEREVGEKCNDLHCKELTQEGVCHNSHSHSMLHRLSQETRDMIDSGDFCQVLNTCLDTAFTRLLDNIACSFKPKQDETRVNFLSISPCDGSLPLAKLIPIMNAQLHFICGDSPNHFVQELLLMDCVKDFAANVYEAFSQSEHTAIP